MLSVAEILVVFRLHPEQSQKIAIAIYVTIIILIDENCSFVLEKKMTSLSNNQIPARSSVSKRSPRHLGFLLEFLLITSAIATSAGIGFGAAIRLNRPEEPGSTILHSEQSFPPRQDWPSSN